MTKNEHFRAMLQNCVHNRIPCRYVLNDIWFASAENMNYIKRTLGKEFIMTQDQSQDRRQDKQHGRYHRLHQLDLPKTQ